MKKKKEINFRGVKVHTTELIDNAIEIHKEIEEKQIYKNKGKKK